MGGQWDKASNGKKIAPLAANEIARMRPSLGLAATCQVFAGAVVASLLTAVKQHIELH